MVSAKEDHMVGQETERESLDQTCIHIIKPLTRPSLTQRHPTSPTSQTPSFDQISTLIQSTIHIKTSEFKHLHVFWETSPPGTHSMTTVAYSAQGEIRILAFIQTVQSLIKSY